MNRMRDASIWWPLWSLLFAAPWLIPNFSLPWPTFDRELLTAAGLLVLAAGLAVAQRERWQLPIEALPFALVGVLPLMQMWGGLINFGGDVWTSSLYIGAFVLAIVLGANAMRWYGSTWLDALWFAFGFAAVLSVGLALGQWLNVEMSPTWTNDVPPGARPFANIGQPNLLGALCCLGLVAVWHGMSRGAVRGSVAIFAALYLLFGVALTQSRAAWLTLGVYVCGAWVLRAQLDSKRTWKAMLALAVIFAGFVASIAWLNETLQLQATQTFAERLEGGLRLRHWASMVEAISQRPLAGWGWNQVSVAQQAVAPGLPAIPELIDRSHDIFLDVLVWSGIPIGSLLIGVSALWLVRTCRRVLTAELSLVLLALGGLAAYAVVEFPHTYLFTLLPAGLFIGSLSLTRPGGRPSAFITRSMAAFVIVLAAGAGAWTAVEYYAAKDNSDLLRFEIARVGTSRGSLPPNLLLLTQIQAILTVDRIPLVDRVSAEQLDLLRRTSERYPAERVLIHYAQAAAMAGDADAARLALTKLCKLYPPARCVAAKKVWKKMADDRYPALRSVTVPEPENP